MQTLTRYYMIHKNCDVQASEGLRDTKSLPHGALLCPLKAAGYHDHKLPSKGSSNGKMSTITGLP